MSLTYGDIRRLLHPLVRDFVGGLVLAGASHEPKLARPQNDGPGEEIQTVGDWPPLPSQYDANGLTNGAGDLARLAYSLSVPNVRAFVLGMAGRAELAGESAVDTIRRMASALALVVGTTDLSDDDLTYAWRSLFDTHQRQITKTGTTQGGTPIVLDGIPVLRSGVYLADASLSMASSNAAGSFRISGTINAIGGLSVLKSDRVLAQIDPVLKGASATFRVTDSKMIGVELTGVEGRDVSWTLYLTVKIPAVKRR